MKHNNVLLRAQSECLNSGHRFRLGAVIHRKGFIYGAGYNKPRKTHPKSTKPYKTICAELDALLNAVRVWPKTFVDGASIYVHRLRRDEKVGLAKPCLWCQEMLEKVGITDVKYSLDE